MRVFSTKQYSRVNGGVRILAGSIVGYLSGMALGLYELPAELSESEFKAEIVPYLISGLALGIIGSGLNEWRLYRKLKL